MIRAVIVSLFLAVPVLADDKPLTPEQATKQAGKVVTVEMKVKTYAALAPGKDRVSLMLYSNDSRKDLLHPRPREGRQDVQGKVE